MKHLLSLALYAMAAAGAVAAPEPFYLAAKAGVYRAEIDSDTGRLLPPVLVAPTRETNFLAFSPDRTRLYATFDHSVGAFATHPDGSLAPLDERDSGGKDTCHLSLDRTGRYLFVVTYATGTLACFPIEPDGSLGDRLSLAQLHGSGPNQARQQNAHAHAAYIDPQNQFLYVCDLGSDRVWIFRFDAKNGALAPADPPFAQVPPGSGPRHLAFGEGGKKVYVAAEMGGTVTVFHRNETTGALSPLGTVSTSPSGAWPREGWSAEIVLHPSGRWLYVSNRRDDSISVFSLAHGNNPELIQNAPVPVRTIRSFWLDPLGKWIVAAGEKSNEIIVLKIDPETGRFATTDQRATLTAPHDVLFQGGE